MPVGMGETSPAAIATIASSSNRSPRAVSPRAIATSPCVNSPNARTSRSPRRRPMSTISVATAPARPWSPRSSASRKAGTSSNPRAGQSLATSSTRRSPRASHPPAFPISPRRSRTMPSQNAQRAPPSRSRSLRCARYARSQAAALSASLPTRWAVTASRSRSAAVSGPATAKRARASAHAWRSNAARARSTPPAMAGILPCACGGRAGPTAGGSEDQTALTRLAIADLRLAAWLRWMTPLLAALSSALLAARCSSVAFSVSPASTASRKRRAGLRTAERTDLLRCRRFSLVLTRLIWDLMLATRMPRVLPAAGLHADRSVAPAAGIVLPHRALDVPSYQRPPSHPRQPCLTPPRYRESAEIGRRVERQRSVRRAESLNSAANSCRLAGEGSYGDGHDRRPGARQPRDGRGVGAARGRARPLRRGPPVATGVGRADPGGVGRHRRGVPAVAGRGAGGGRRARRPRGARLGWGPRRERRHDPAGPAAQLVLGRPRRLRAGLRVAPARADVADAR